MEVEMENVDIFNKRREKLENIRERGKLEKMNIAFQSMFGFLKTINYGFSNVLMKRRYFPDYGNNQVEAL